MERISIFNYEAYYLDYLEGNLSEEDTALLIDFLRKYPECALECEELPILPTQQAHTADKSALYMCDEEEEISLMNIEHFMIAESEGILNSAKSNEVNAFVEKHQLKAQLKSYRAMKFQPILSEVYSNKATLKQERGLVLAPYWRVAAAAAAVVAVIYWWPQANEPKMPKFAYTGKSPSKNTTIKTPGEHVSEESELVADIPAKNPTDHQLVSPFETLPKTPSVKTPEITDRLSYRPTKGVTSDYLSNKELQPITAFAYSYSQTEENRGSDVARVDFAEMNNPIEPITKAISKQTNTDVDFRSAKPSKSRPGGFFLKIGKFEVSHKKH